MAFWQPGRFIPANMAMITSSAEPRLRGGFMSLNTSVQQFASAFAALGSGLIVGQAADGRLTGYGTIGFISAGLVIVSIMLASRLRRESLIAVDFVAPVEKKVISDQ